MERAGSRQPTGLERETNGKDLNSTCSPGACSPDTLRPTASQWCCRHSFLQDNSVPKKPDGAPVLSSLPLAEILNPGTQWLTNVILFLSLSGVSKLVSQMPHLLSHFPLHSKSKLAFVTSKPYISAWHPVPCCPLLPFTLPILASSCFSKVNSPFFTLNLAVPNDCNTQHVLCNN